MATAAEDAHHHLVDQLIARGSLWSRPLIASFRRTPRHCFLDRVFHYQRQQGGWREVATRNPGRAELRLLYSDRALTTRLSEAGSDLAAVPISSSSQPSLMAQMLEDLHLSAGLRTLEIGAGTGFNAALMAAVVGSVVSIDVDRRVLAEAAEHLRSFPDRQVEFHHADGRSGWPEGAPYDRIIVTAATPDLEPAWLEQLAPDGLLLAPLELAAGLAYLVRGRCVDRLFEGQLTRPAYFMPLRGEDETGRAEASAPYLPGPERLQAVAAPWAEWSERKTSSGGPTFFQSLAFLAWLQGLTVSYQAMPDGRTAYGVGDLIQGHVCWLGAREWRITGPAGLDLGKRLWRTFLDAGGPWPTEYRLRAGPAPAGPCGSLPEPGGESHVFLRQGPRCRQAWQLPEMRQRPGAL
jgi:protein-L-isoaspartate(D-aspartate) O-methyltransferase